MSSSCCDCGGGGATATLLVVTYPRMDMGDGLGSNTVAGCDGSGNVLWRYDTGNDADGHVILCGQPQIDSSGNVYLPWISSFRTGALKLNDSGALQWSYDFGHPGKGTTPGSIDIASSDFDASGNIAFRSNDGGAITVSPAGSLVSHFSWVSAGAPAGQNPLVVYWGFAVDANNNAYMSSDQTTVLYKFDSSGAYVCSFASGRTAKMACDKANGKLYIYRPHLGNSSLPLSTTTIAERWDLSTSTPTQDWLKTYDDIFHADSPVYSAGSSPGPTNGGVGFDDSTGSISLVVGRILSTFGSTHIVANALNLSGAGAKNWSAIVDTNTGGDGFTADSVCVDPTNSGTYCAGRFPTGSGSYSVFGISFGSLTWSSALIAPANPTAKGLGARTYTK